MLESNNSKNNMCLNGRSAYISIAKRVFSKYEYALLSDEEKEKIFDESIRECINSQIDLDNLIQKRYESLLNKLIKDYISSKLTNFDYAKNIIKMYIKNKIGVPNSLSEAKEYIDIFIKFIAKLKYNNLFEIYEIAIKNIDIIKMNLDYIYDKCKYVIKKGLAYQVLNGDELSLLEVYLMCENIDEDIDIYGVNDSSSTVQDSLNIYMNDMGSIDVLTKEQEEKLGWAILEGRNAQKKLEEITSGKENVTNEQIYDLKESIKKGELAERKLVEANLRFVIVIAKNKPFFGTDFLDFIQEGNMGLMKAASKFDITKGYRFNTYARWWINLYIKKYIYSIARSYKLPEYQSEKIKRLYREKAILTHELYREPTNKELASRLGISEKNLNKLLMHANAEISLNAKIGDEDDTELGDMIISEEIPVEEKVMESVLSDSIYRLIDAANLSEKERDVLERRNGLNGRMPETLKDIASSYGVTRERIRQIEELALNKLRRRKELKKLSGFLDNQKAAEKNVDEFNRTGIMVKNVTSYANFKQFYTSSKLNKPRSIIELLDKWDPELVKQTANDILTDSEWELIVSRSGTRDLSVKAIRRLNFEEKSYQETILKRLKTELKKRENYLENINGSIYDMYREYSHVLIDEVMRELTSEELNLLEKRKEYYQFADEEKTIFFDLLNHIYASLNAKIVLKKKKQKEYLLSIKNRLNDLFKNEEALSIFSKFDLIDAMIICLVMGYNILYRKFTKEEISILLDINKKDVDSQIADSLKKYLEVLKKENNIQVKTYL